MFILTSLTLPFAARTAFSMIGVSWRQGPHHGAQKSISTGWRFDSSMTSFTKVWVVVSLIRSGAACGAAPLVPCSAIVTGILVRCLEGAGSSTARNGFHKVWTLKWRVGRKFQSGSEGYPALPRPEL